MSTEGFGFEKWFVETMMGLAPDPDKIRVDGAPLDMTDIASNKCFSLSFASGMMPGSFGMVTILPELAALTEWAWQTSPPQITEKTKILAHK